MSSADGDTADTGVRPGPAPKWYACYTRGRHEKQVERLLKRSGLECYLPLVPRSRKWKDRRRVVLFPMFPSYVFARFRRDQMYDVITTPGVATILRVRGRFLVIRPEELDNIRLFENRLAASPMPVEFRSLFVEGDWVEFQGGEFAGVRGVVIERRGRRRVLVGLPSLGGLLVNVGTHTLQPAPPP